IPIRIPSYLASATNRLLRRDRSPPDGMRCNSTEYVGLDADDTPAQSSNERIRSEEMVLTPASIAFALPGGANRAFGNGPFSEHIGPNNNAAAWMGLGVAIGAFALVFGGYVALAGMGSPATVRDGDALGPR